MPEPTHKRTPLANTTKRLTRDDSFRFACGPHVPCFTECCGKLELILTPYDVLRLKTRLGLSSGDFIDEYTTMRMRTAHGFPDLVMRMDHEAGKRCPFVTAGGCSVYEDRPGACRIYPLGRASTRHPLHGGRSEFYFVVREDHCKGFEQPKEWLVSEWLEDQGMEDYNRMNDLLMELYVHRTRGRSVALGQQHVQMFIMACYNTERFRSFIFESPFLRKFHLDRNLVESIRVDDAKLLEFAFQWLKFALFQEPTLKVRGADATPNGLRPPPEQ
ncbi:MAG: YkgJ family cysteine cluster protein [Thermodesulfobacteriota bacterium]